jgi:hypothetical protein
MANRVLLGLRGSDYGLFVSKPGGNVLSDGDIDLLLSSENTGGIGQILLFQEIAVSANATTTQNYNNRGGGKTFFYWWSGASTGYSASVTFLTGTALTVKSKFVNSTTNQIEVVNSGGSNATIVALVLNKAAA